jgi:hypothetical protein
MAENTANAARETQVETQVLRLEQFADRFALLQKRAEDRFASVLTSPTPNPNGKDKAQDITTVPLSSRLQALVNKLNDIGDEMENMITRTEL